MKDCPVWFVSGTVKVDRGSGNPVSKDRRHVLLCARSFDDAVRLAADALALNWSTRTVSAEVDTIRPYTDANGARIEVVIR